MTRIVCQQIAPQVGQPEANRALSLHAIRDAVDLGAEIIVLPELANSGYMFDSAQEAAAQSIGLKDELLQAGVARRPRAAPC